jgi:CTP synthase
VNPAYVSQLESKGLRFIGKDERGERMIILELDPAVHDHPYYVATQYHPEYKTRPLTPVPVFLGLILASCGELNSYLEVRVFF